MSATAAVSAATAVTQNVFLVPNEAKLAKDIEVGSIRPISVHDSLNGIQREFLEEFETGFEDAYADAFRESVGNAIADCTDEIQRSEFQCNIECGAPEWCCEPLSEGLVQCLFKCAFVRNGESIFEVGGALSYELN